NYRHMVKKVVIGNDITAIGNYAFAYTQTLAAVEFEEGSVLQSVGVLSFMNAAKLTEVTLPETVTAINAYAFGYCGQLVNVYVPENTTFIYKTAFGSSDNVILSVAAGSYAESFAATNGVDYTTR
ncbi:MAG: leucine-rich repeat domain-containing protein, partial [Acutalibacteraceae bacterium]